MPIGAEIEATSTASFAALLPYLDERRRRLAFGGGAGASSPYLNAQSAAHLGAGQPVISVDTRKKELVGQYKNGGCQWRPAGDPTRVNVHDFIDPRTGKANRTGSMTSRRTPAGYR